MGVVTKQGGKTQKERNTMVIAEENKTIQKELVNQLKAIMIKRGVSLLQAQLIMRDQLSEAVDAVREELS